MPPISPKGLKAFFKGPATQAGAASPFGGRQRKLFIDRPRTPGKTGLVDKGFGTHREDAGPMSGFRDAQGRSDKPVGWKPAAAAAAPPKAKAKQIDPDLKARNDLMKDTRDNARSMSSADQAKIAANWNKPGEGLKGYEPAGGTFTGSKPAAKPSVGFGKGRTRPKVKLEPDAQKALKEHAAIKAQIKDVESKLRDPKHAKYAPELRARLDRLHRKLP
jgi:hypothetical protein